MTEDGLDADQDIIADSLFLTVPHRSQDYLTRLVAVLPSEPLYTLPRGFDQGKVATSRVFELGTEHSIVTQTLSTLAKTWHAVVVIDATAGGGAGEHDNYLRYYRERLGGALREINWNQRSKQAMVDGLSLAIEAARLDVDGRRVARVAAVQAARRVGDRHERALGYACQPPLRIPGNKRAAG